MSLYKNNYILIDIDYMYEEKKKKVKNYCKKDIASAREEKP